MYQKVDHNPKQCLWCSEVFKPTTSHQNFCNKNCYRKWGKKYKGHSNGKYHPVIGPKFRKPRYTMFKGDYCESCGFVPEDLCQLDVDHIDGDHSNNSPDNLQTLCANCHRLKTKRNRDGIYIRHK